MPRLKGSADLLEDRASVPWRCWILVSRLTKWDGASAAIQVR
jgi:hypothetical protein